MPEIPKEILELARNQHRQASTLEKRALSAVRRRMAQAAARVEKRLEAVDDESFAAQQARITLLLERIVQAETEAELDTILQTSMGAASQLGPAHTGDQLSKWLEHYGHEARPINLAAVAELSESILVERIPRSLERWGPQVAKRMRDELAIAAAGRLDREKTVDAIHKTINAERWQADRIVRTETSEAYNASHEASLHYAAEKYNVDDDLKKSAIATFDGRTDEDSYPVHGQVVALDGNFEDGDGRLYPHPPGRPNDREKEIAWMEESAALIMDREEGIAQSEEAKGLNMEEAARKKRAEERAARRARLRLETASRGKTFEERRSQLGASWVHGSHNRRSIEMKSAVADHFGVPGVVYDKNELKLDDGDVEETAGDLRRIYADTQKKYREDGVTHVDLYRGIKTEVDDMGVVESWTTDPEVAEKFDGHTVLKERVDVRRVLWHHEADGWRNGKYGDQSEHLVLTAIPEPEWERGNFRLGGFDVEEIDESAEVAGHWGVYDYNTDGTKRALVHTKTGRELLVGNYSRDTLKETALQLDRRGHVDALGRLAGADEREDFDNRVAELAEAAVDNRVAEFAKTRGSLDWTSSDYHVGGEFTASDFGKNPEAAGVWGIVERPGRRGEPPAAVLEHLPSGEVVLEGAYSRDQLKAAAGDLDKFIDDAGRFPGEDNEIHRKFVADLRNARRYHHEDTVDGFDAYFVDEEVKVGERTVQGGGQRILSGTGDLKLGEKADYVYADTWERTEDVVETQRNAFDYSQVDRFVDVGGVKFPAINDTVEKIPRSPRVVANVLRETTDGSASFIVEKRKGYVRGNFFLYKSKSSYSNPNGYEVNDWHIVHKASGVELHQGVAMPVESGAAGGIDVGGWRMHKFEDVAEELNGYFDDEGNVRPDKRKGWLSRIAELEAETAPGFDAADALGVDPYEMASNPISRRTRVRMLENPQPDLDPSDEEAAQWRESGPSAEEADSTGYGAADDIDDDLPF